MGKQWSAKFINIRKSPIFPFAVGFIIACAVFALAYTLKSEWTSNILILILVAPGLMASFALVPDSAFFGPLVSSLYFGSMVGFLVSKQRYVRIIGLLLIFLLVYFGCYLLL